MKSWFWTVLLCLIVATLIFIREPLYTNANAALATIPPTNTKRPPATSISGDGSTVESNGTAVIITPTASPTFSQIKVSIPAQLCSDCARVRLRETPGTAGQVLDFLDSTVSLTILGRSDDGKWVQVSVEGLPNADDAQGGVVGWLSVNFVRVKNGQPLDQALIDSLPVLDVAVQASPSPTSNIGIPVWLSGITAHAHEIFVKGQQLGNRANVFSRVGDSMSASPYFLTPIGQGQYNLGAYGELADVINYYSQEIARTANSFANQSLAAGGGWSSFTLLLPGYSAPNICGKDSPLVCEYKQIKPAVALIMVGTNDSGSGSTGPFKGSLDEIIQTSIDMGVIPVLSTIPPKRIDANQTERVDAFNSVIRATAQQYDIPLWDYYSVMATLPDLGMGKDGLHASVPPNGATGTFTEENLKYGYTLRNLMALQVLDTLRKLVMY